MDEFIQAHGLQCNSKGWDISDTTWITKSWTLKPEISSIGHSKDQGEKRALLWQCSKMRSSGSISLSKFNGIKWGTICQTFCVYVICPSYLLTKIVWTLLYFLLFSPTCCLYKWKISIHLSLPFVLFSSCSPFLTPQSWMRLCGLNDAVGDISFTLLFHSVAWGSLGRTMVKWLKWDWNSFHPGNMGLQN